MANPPTVVTRRRRQHAAEVVAGVPADIDHRAARVELLSRDSQGTNVPKNVLKEEDMPVMRAFPKRRAATILGSLLAITVGSSAYVVSVGSLSSDSLASTAASPSDAVAEWFEYDRPATFESVVTDVRVPTRDGTELDCELFRPGHDGQPDDGQHPGIIADFTPYGSTGASSAYYAERGYNVLHCDVRGSDGSEGDFPSWFPKVEARDNYDIIEWLAEQSYSTGDVGQTGSSYGSITAYRAAALGPPSLRTIVPIVSPTNIYSEWVYPGGVPSSNGAWWQTAPVVSPNDKASTLKSFQENPTYNSYWKQVATTNKLKHVDVPALHIGGYFDIFKEGSFDALEQRPEQTWLLTGPWIHGGFLGLPGEDARATVDLSYGAILEWFDHWLMDLPGADLPPERVVSFESTSDDGAGRWIADRQWPVTGGTTTRLFPIVNGILETQAPANSMSRYSVNPYDGASVGVTGTMPYEPGQNQAGSERNSVTGANDRCRDCARTTFTLPAFDSGTSIAGQVSFHLEASITARDTYFVSKLETVLPDGRVLPIETGYLRAQLRSSLSRPEKIQAGKRMQYTIELGNMHWKFQKGEKLRVTLGAGDFPRIQPTAPAGIVTIHHGPETYLDLPVVP